MKQRIVALAFIGVVLAACGGGENDASLAPYLGDIAALRSELQRAGDEAQQRVDDELAQVSSLDDALAILAESTTSASGRVGEFLDDLNAIDPPPRMKDLHQELISVFEDQQSALVRVRDEITSREGLDELRELDQEMDELFSGLQERSEAVCLDLQGIADDSSIDIDLDCRDEDAE